jgi:hypothetical protein
MSAPSVVWTPNLDTKKETQVQRVHEAVAVEVAGAAIDDDDVVGMVDDASERRERA